MYCWSLPTTLSATIAVTFGSWRVTLIVVIAVLLSTSAVRIFLSPSTFSDSFLVSWKGFKTDAVSASSAKSDLIAPIAIPGAALIYPHQGCFCSSRYATRVVSSLPSSVCTRVLKSSRINGVEATISGAKVAFSASGLLLAPPPRKEEARLASPPPALSPLISGERVTVTVYCLGMLRAMIMPSTTPTPAAL